MRTFPAAQKVPGGGVPVGVLATAERSEARANNDHRLVDCFRAGGLAGAGRERAPARHPGARLHAVQLDVHPVLVALLVLRAHHSDDPTVPQDPVHHPGADAPQARATRPKGTRTA